MDILSLSIADIIDVLLVATILYQLFALIRGTAAMYIFAAVVVIYFAWLVSKFLGMELISTLLGQIIGIGMIALVVVFQQEIRQFLLYIGNKYFTLLNHRFNQEGGIDLSYIDEIVMAVDSMSSTLTGALIVFSRKNGLELVKSSGDVIDARPSQRLIENIFFKNSPLHDGAMIISQGRVAAARCVLPSSERADISPSLGMRHRAAIGISEQTDVVVVVVSEQTGRISCIEAGVIVTSLTSVQLKERLVKSL